MFAVLRGLGARSRSRDGILTKEVNELLAPQQAVGADLVEPFSENGVIVVLSVVGSIGLGVAMIAAVVALRAAYGLGWVPFALMLLATPLIAIHEPPFGPLGWPCSSARYLLLVRQQASLPPRPAPALDQRVSAKPARRLPDSGPRRR